MRELGVELGRRWGSRSVSRGPVATAAGKKAPHRTALRVRTRRAPHREDYRTSGSLPKEVPGAGAAATRHPEPPTRLAWATEHPGHGIRNLRGCRTG